eukprot:TRINITY_DN103958_c0_g1_i1.p1 TRINITY_DN103958_c0_g1~~TRINITY_DN103958_c0_g1_i1.p1  ORF type:complete len:108 (-),score=16.80 TRINITY_DN103958_c0_g1_i1:231-554(-)
MDGGKNPSCVDHQNVEISTLHLGFSKTQNSGWCFSFFGLFPLASFTDCWGVASHLLGCSLLLAAPTVGELQVVGSASSMLVSSLSWNYNYLTFQKNPNKKSKSKNRK